MKSLTQYITEAAKPVKEFETILGVKLPAKSKVDNGVLTFDMPDKKWKGLDGWWYEFKVLHKNDLKHIQSLKDESALKYDYN